MDLRTTTAGIVIILMCIIPFIIVIINGRKRKKKLLQGLFKIAERNNCKITRHDIWNNSSIGIDAATNVVFFTRKVKDSATFQVVSLAEIHECRVVNNSRTINNKEGKFTVTEKLAIVFLKDDKNKSEVVLEFFNAQYDSLTLTGELQLMEKWSKIFNSAIAALVKQNC